MPAELVTIGKIIGHFGYKGDVKVTPLTDFPQRFEKLKQVMVNKNGQISVAKIEKVKVNHNMLLVKFSGINSKESAQEIRGSLLQIEESELYPLPEGYYYHFQLTGLKVIDVHRGFIGILADILETGANDVYLIKSSEYGEVLIPAIKEVIKIIDLENQSMQVELLPGLIDDKG